MKKGIKKGYEKCSYDMLTKLDGKSIYAISSSLSLVFKIWSKNSYIKKKMQKLCNIFRIYILS